MGLWLWILAGLHLDARAAETVTLQSETVTQQSETVTQQSETVTLQEVVVTASRDTEETVKVPAHVTVVTAEQIQKSNHRNVPEALGALAGVHITDISGNQRNYNVDLRGFGESSQQNILLLVDGRRVNLPDLSGPDWNLIPLERIERIEVIRGGRGNVLYGDNATAGVINIITREGRAVEATATAKYGSYDTVKANASVSAAHDTVAYDITAGYYNSDGYRDNSESDAKDVGGNLKFDPTDSLRLHLSGGYHYDDTRNPGALLQSDLDAGAEPTDTVKPDDFSKFEDYYAKIGLENDMLSNDMFKLETSYRNRESAFFGTYSGGWFDADTTTDIWTVSPQLIFRGDFDGISNHVTMGLDFTQAEQGIDNTSYSEFSNTTSRNTGTLEKNNIAYYIHDRLGVGDKLFLSGGYRHDRVKFKYDYEDVKSQKIIDEEAANVGINYAFGPNSKLYGSFSQGFRYPVMDEQFDYINNEVDPDLQPQRSRNYEAGGSMQIVSGFVLRLNLFRTEIKDEIFYNTAAFKNQNMDGKTIRQGAEVGFDWRWKALNIGAGYTYTDTEFDGGDYDGNEVPAVPRDRATARIGYTIAGGLFVGADAVYVGERFLLSDFNNEFDKAENYTVVNAKIQYEWRWLSFFVDLNNVFDEAYSTFSGLQYNASTFTNEPGFYPSPEFNVLAGIRGRFGGNK
jgi:iron complex outermembrane receptor protein